MCQLSIVCRVTADDAMKIDLISNMGVVIYIMIQIMLSLTFILSIEYLIHSEVHNLACFYFKIVRFEGRMD